MVWESETDGNPSVDADESNRRRLDRTVSYNSVAYLTNRYNLPDDLAKNIAGIDSLIQNALA
jgi:hypothetical protein